MTNSQIRSRLCMSPKTASVRKLEATNRVHAAAIAERAGLVGLSE
jgi:DNA-binding CsgD family transcriptional regulator